MFETEDQEDRRRRSDEGSPDLLESGSILSLHNTSEGPIAYVRAHDGSIVVVPYGREWQRGSDRKIASEMGDHGERAA